jgi:F-type H+-transporting ATPase subunit b
MRSDVRSGWTFAFAALLLGLAAPDVRAAESEAKIYKGTVLKDGKEVEQRFDLSKPGERAELDQLLEEGHIEGLERDKPPSVLDFRWDLGLWTFVVFLVLLAILGKMAWGPMLEGLKKREENIRGALAEAQRHHDEAKKMREELQVELAGAQQQVRDIVASGRKDAERLADEILTKARAEIEAERERLHHEVDMARDQALAHIWNKSTELATLISSKAIRRNLNPDDHRRLLDEAIAEIRQAAGQRQKETAVIRT